MLDPWEYIEGLGNELTDAEASKYFLDKIMPALKLFSEEILKDIVRELRLEVLKEDYSLGFRFWGDKAKAQEKIYNLKQKFQRVVCVNAIFDCFHDSHQGVELFYKVCDEVGLWKVKKNEKKV